MSNDGFNPFGLFGKPSGPTVNDTVLTQIGNMAEKEKADAATDVTNITKAGINEGRGRGRASNILGGGQGSLISSANTYSAGRTLLGA